MICLATYESLEEIPEALRGEFEQEGSKWQLKKDAVPGAGELFNASLKANADRAVDQVKARNVTIEAQKAEIELLKNQVGAESAPGSIVLAAQDAKAWERYAAMGTPKELEARLAGYEEIKQRAETAELKDTLATVGEGLGLNTGVLADWIGSQPAGSVALFAKDGTAKDAKTGKDVAVKVPMLKLTEDLGNGKVKESEVELLPYAKEKMKDYMYEALTKAAAAETKETAAAAQPTGGVRMPALGSAKPTTTAPAGGERPVDRFNAQRAARPSPFSQPAPAAAK